MASTDVALDLHTVVGQPITVGFGDEPFLKNVEGIVKGGRQLTTVLSDQGSVGVSLYEIEVVPRLWLTTRRVDHRIFQHKSVPEIIDAVLAGYGARIPAAGKALASQPSSREYCVQYGETDHDFIFRLLAEESIASFFDHEKGSLFTLCDDTFLMTSKMKSPISFAATSSLNAGTPHVFNVLVSARVETSTVTLRDYDYENPRLKLKGKEKIGSHLGLVDAWPHVDRLQVEV